MTSNRMIQTRFPYKSGVKGRKTSNNNISNNNMGNSNNGNSLKKRRLHQGKIDFGKFDKNNNLQNDNNSSLTSSYFSTSTAGSTSNKKSTYLHQQMLSDLNYKKVSPSVVLKKIQDDYYKDQEQKEKKYEDYVEKIIEKNPYYKREKQNSEQKQRQRRRNWINNREEENNSIIEIEDSIEDESTEEEIIKTKGKEGRHNSTIVISDEEEDNDNNVNINNINKDDIIDEGDNESNSSQEFIVKRKISSNKRKRSRIIEDDDEDEGENKNNNKNKTSLKHNSINRSQKNVIALLDNPFKGNINSKINPTSISYKISDGFDNFNINQNSKGDDLNKNRVKKYQLSLRKKRNNKLDILDKDNDQLKDKVNSQNANTDSDADNFINDDSIEEGTSNAGSIEEDDELIISENEEYHSKRRIDKKGKGSIILFGDDDITEICNKRSDYVKSNDKKEVNYQNQSKLQNRNNLNNNNNMNNKNNNINLEDGKNTNDGQIDGRLSINYRTNQYFNDLEKLNNSNNSSDSTLKVKLGNLYDYVKIVKKIDNRDNGKNDLKSDILLSPQPSSSSTEIEKSTNNKPSICSKENENIKALESDIKPLVKISTQNETSNERIISNNDVTLDKNITNDSHVIITNNIDSSNNNDIKHKDIEMTSKSFIIASTTPPNNKNNVLNKDSEVSKKITIPTFADPTPPSSLISISSLTSNIMSNKIIPFLFKDQDQEEENMLEFNPESENCIVQLLFSDFMQWFSKSLCFASPYHLLQHLCNLPLQEMAKVKVSPYFKLMNKEIYEDLNQLGLNYYSNLLTKTDYKRILKRKREEVKNFLRHFDLQPIFGNYIGITRMERYQRAIAMALLDDIYYHYYNLSKKQNMSLSLSQVSNQYKYLKNEINTHYQKKNTESSDKSVDDNKNVEKLNKLIKDYQNKLSLIYTKNPQSSSSYKRKKVKRKSVNIKDEETSLNENEDSDNIYGDYGGFWPPQPVLGFIECCELDDKEILESINYKSY